MAATCPSCGHDVKVVGDTTQHYQPIGCGQPPPEGAAIIREALALMRSMILSGEKMTPSAELVVDGALALVKSWR